MLDTKFQMFAPESHLIPIHSLSVALRRVQK